MKKIFNTNFATLSLIAIMIAGTANAGIFNRRSRSSQTYTQNQGCNQNYRYRRSHRCYRPLARVADAGYNTVKKVIEKRPIRSGLDYLHRNRPVRRAVQACTRGALQIVRAGVQLCSGLVGLSARVLKAGFITIGNATYLIADALKYGYVRLANGVLTVAKGATSILVNGTRIALNTAANTGRVLVNGTRYLANAPYQQGRVVYQNNSANSYDNSATSYDNSARTYSQKTVYSNQAPVVEETESFGMNSVLVN